MQKELVKQSARRRHWRASILNCAMVSRPMCESRRRSKAPSAKDTLTQNVFEMDFVKCVVSICLWATCDEHKRLRNDLKFIAFYISSDAIICMVLSSYHPYSFNGAALILSGHFLMNANPSNLPVWFFSFSFRFTWNRWCVTMNSFASKLMFILIWFIDFDYGFFVPRLLYEKLWIFGFSFLWINYD